MEGDGKKGEGEKTYTIPKPKTVINVIFLYSAIWSLYRLLIGRTITATSVMRLMMPVAVKEETWFPQYPPAMFLSQLYAKGRQIRQPARMVAMVQATMIDIVA